MVTEKQTDMALLWVERAEENLRLFRRSIANGEPRTSHLDDATRCCFEAELACKKTDA